MNRWHRLVAGRPRFAFTLRRKFAVAFAAVALAVVIVAGVIDFAVTQHSLRTEIDRSLESAATTLSTGGTVSTGGSTGLGRGDGDGPGRGDQGIVQVAQTVTPDGTVTVTIGQQLPVNPALDRLLTATAGQQLFVTTDRDDRSYRVLAVALGGGAGMIMVGRDLGEVSSALEDLAWSMLWLGLGVLIIAAAVGWLLARQLTRRLTALTDAAERVACTGALDLEIPVAGQDEVATLGAAMHGMLAELARSRDDQQRLVQDAGHELRTPLTSLRTNVSVLRRFDELSPQSRQRLLEDVQGEAKELTDLVNELVELATDRRATEPFEPVDLSVLAERIAERYRRRSGRNIQVVAGDGDTTVQGRPQSVERALSNLVDNALKFDPDGHGGIEIRVQGTILGVADRGPGLAEDDTGRIFDRFYRATAARSMPGSGLGLSIVRDVAQAHGGSVSASNRPGGGAVIQFTLGPQHDLPNSKLNEQNT